MPAYLTRDTLPHDLAHKGHPIVDMLAREFLECWCGGFHKADTGYPGYSRRAGRKLISEVDRFGARAPLVECRACGTLRRHFTFNEVVSSYYYRLLYRRFHPEAGTYEQRGVKQHEDAERVAALTWGRPHGEVTEIGADTGAASNVFPGYTGVERDPEVALTTFREQSLVYAVHTLEHLPDAHWIVEHAMGALAPGGYLVLVVPDYSRAEESMYGAEDWATHAHVWEWTRETFEAFLRDALRRYVQPDGCMTLDIHVDGPGVWASIPSIVAVVRRGP